MICALRVVGPPHDGDWGLFQHSKLASFSIELLVQLGIWDPCLPEVLSHMELNVYS